MASAAASTPALAATVERDDVDSADVFFTAAPGEANGLVVSVEPAGVRFVDAGAEILTRTCRRITPHEVLCEGLVDTLIVETGDGDDVIDASAAPVAFAVGEDGNDRIVAARGSGGPGNDVLRGLAAGSVLRGGPGNDSVTGGAGPDTLAGGESAVAAGSDDDVVQGGAGADVLELGAGADRVDGGGGDDTYVLAGGARGVDATIADSGGDGGDTIRLACAGTRLVVTAGARQRSGRYTFAGGVVSFSGLDGALPCAAAARRAVPRVVGLPLARARRVLAAAGFRVGTVRHVRSRTVRRGSVVSQRPVARRGATAPVGARVTLVVSSGR